MTELFYDSKQVAAVLREYRFQPIEILQVRGVMKVVTPYGSYALKATKATASQLEATYKKMRELGPSSCLHTFFPNIYGDPYIVDWNQNWYVTNWVDSQSWNVRSSQDGDQLIRLAGQLHRKSDDRSIREEKSNGERRIEYWETQLSLMEEEVKKLSEYNRVLEYPLNYMLDTGKKAVHLLQETFHYRQTHTDQSIAFCHGSIHPSNVLNTPKGQLLIDYDHCSYDHPARDLAVIFRGQLPKFYWDKSVGIRWLQMYRSFHPFSREDQKHLAVLLMFPQKLVSFLSKREQVDTRKNTEWKLRFERLYTDLNYMQRFVQALYNV